MVDHIEACKLGTITKLPFCTSVRASNWPVRAIAFIFYRSTLIILNYSLMGQTLFSKMTGREAKGGLGRGRGKWKKSLVHFLPSLNFQSHP